MGLAGGGEHQLGDGPDEGVEAVGAFAVGEAVGGEVAHLPLELGELADVGDAALRIERGDRLSAQAEGLGYLTALLDDMAEASLRANTPRSPSR